MKHTMFIGAVIFALGLTYGGAEILMSYVEAADGLKSSLISFVLAMGFALLGPAFLVAAIFFRRKNDARGMSRNNVPATPKQIHRPYLHGL